MDCMDVDYVIPSKWQHFTIRHDNTLLVYEYTVSVLNQAYFFTYDNTPYLREPKMKHRDMIVDNYKKAGGTLSTLRRIGVNLVTNYEVYLSIQNAFDAKGLEFPASGSVRTELVRTPEFPIYRRLPVFHALILNPIQYVKIPVNRNQIIGASESLVPLTHSSCPTEPGWLELIANNELIHDQRRMLDEYRDELGGVTIDKVVVVANGVSSIGMHNLYMATHLKRQQPHITPTAPEKPLLQPTSHRRSGRGPSKR